MIKALETAFDGHRFRSRTEARWAVFFKTLNIPYSYEVEGFQLDSGRYLPDFFIPAWSTWIEIKPPYIEALDKELQRWSEFAAAIEKPCLLIMGDPWPGEYRLVSVLKGTLRESQFAECKECGAICLEGVPFSLDSHSCVSTPGLFLPRLATAFKEARESRFNERRRGRRAA